MNTQLRRDYFSARLRCLRISALGVFPDPGLTPARQHGSGKPAKGSIFKQRAAAGWPAVPTSTATMSVVRRPVSPMVKP
jgi:hypothetical protein